MSSCKIRKDAAFRSSDSQKSCNINKNISKFEYYHNVENVSKDSKYRLKHMYLLYFFGLKDLANKQFEEYYSLLINEIEDKSKKDRTRNVDYLMSFIKELKILGIDYKNPYKKCDIYLECDPPNREKSLEKRNCCERNKV